MTQMNPETVNQLAQELLEFFADEAIPIEYMSVNINVTAEYLPTITPNFPVRNRSKHDLAVTVHGKNWYITLGIALFPKFPDDVAHFDDPLASTDNETQRTGDLPMNEQRITGIMRKVEAIFDRYEIDYAGWQIVVRTTAEFFDAVRRDLVGESDDVRVITNKALQVSIRQYKRFTFGFTPTYPEDMNK